MQKIFLHITPAEQVRRFKDRLTNPLKRWKLSYEDFRNRTRWADYEVAIEDMMEKTSYRWAPWYLIPANDKPYGRLATFTILIEVLGSGLHLRPRPWTRRSQRWRSNYLTFLKPSDSVAASDYQLHAQTEMRSIADEQLD